MGKSRCIEWFCGIGAFAYAFSDSIAIAAAVDIDQDALSIYRKNFSHRAVCETIESIQAAEIEDWNADLWWMSPPCQPFTRRGKQLDDRDNRSQALLRLIELIPQIGPRAIALENVPEFQGSRTHQRLLSALQSSGYWIEETIACPTELGIPGRRRRYYAKFTCEPARPFADLIADYQLPRRRLAEFLGDDHSHELRLDPGTIAKYASALDRVSPDDPAAIAACFTSAYGTSPVRSGSYLENEAGNLRYFHPAEVAALLGFAADYRLPNDWDHRKLWSLLGNSLSIYVLRVLFRDVFGR